ncbi:MAG: hypothetical protein ACI4OX_00175 [Akkermansia sp.]
MKNLLCFLFLAAAAWCSALMAASEYESTLSRAGRKPVVLFCYGVDFDKNGPAVREAFIGKKGIAPALKGAILLEVPVYQNPDEKQKKEWEKLMGNKSLPGGIWSYPCLAVVDGRGNLRGIVQSAEEMKSPETACAALRKLVKAFDEQEALLAKAQTASGTRRPKLVARAADVPIMLPADLRSSRRRRANDRPMKDTIGLEKRLKFDPLAVVTKLQPLKPAEANTYIRRLMLQGCYSRLQRQEMMAAYAGHLRRSGASRERLRAAYTEMRNIDPTTVYAAYAEGAIALWVDSQEAVAKETAAKKQKAEAAGKSPLGSTEKPEDDWFDDEEPAPATTSTTPKTPSKGKGTKTALGSTEIPEDDEDEDEEED